MIEGSEDLKHEIDTQGLEHTKNAAVITPSSQLLCGPSEKKNLTNVKRWP